MKPFLDPNVVKPFLDPNVAHPAKFVDLHRIESSAELAELTRRHQREGGCCAAPTLLLWTNLPCLLAGALHLFHQRLVPGIIFVLLALASCVFHYQVDLRLIPSVFWARTDRALAYAGMIYHVVLLVQERSVWALFSSSVCIGSVFLYTSAYSAWEKGHIDRYIWLHSLWHIGAGIGTLAFASIN